MNATDAMKEMSRTARNRTGALGHSMRDRALEKRLQRVSGEADRLRFENDLLREEVAETRSEHHRILDVIEARLPEPESRTTSGSHRGRWILALLAIGGGAVAWVRARALDDGRTEWLGDGQVASVTQSSATTI